MSPAKHTLEVLRAAEASLLDESRLFAFMDGSSCTCGHLYAAFVNEAPGHVAGITTSAHDEEYAKVAIEVATALGWNSEGPYYQHYTEAENALWFISDETSHVFERRAELDNDPDTDDDEGVTREDALVVIREAISKIEAHEEQARLQVVA